MFVKDIMSPHVASVTQDDTAQNAAQIMKNNNIGALPVVSGNELCGIVTDRDIILRCVADGKSPDSCKISEVMTTSAATIEPDKTVTDAVTLMASEQVRRLPVVDNGQLVGIVSLCDVAKLRKNAEVANALCEISMP